MLWFNSSLIGLFFPFVSVYENEYKTEENANWTKEKLSHNIYIWPICFASVLLGKMFLCVIVNEVCVTFFDFFTSINKSEQKWQKSLSLFIAKHTWGYH